MMQQKRDITIDILRALALMGLVVAHVQPPSWVFQLRSFDVPMMVFLAGTSYSMSKTATIPYSKYVWHRFKRIIIPTWIFLLLYFFFFRHESLTTIIPLFTLLTDWFVWIMRVFFIIAICAPIILYTLKRIHFSYGFILILSLLFNEILCHHFTPPGTAPDAISTIVIMNVAYLIIFCIGCQIGDMSKQTIILIGIVAFCIYITMTLYYYFSTGHYVQTQEKKYPPQAYYIAYALSFIVLFWLMRNTISSILSKFRVAHILAFIGSHTMWIYFHHIFILDVTPMHYNFGIRFIIVFTTATLITSLQHLIITRTTKLLPPQINKTIRLIFDG